MNLTEHRVYELFASVKKSDDISEDLNEEEFEKVLLNIFNM